MQPQEFSYNILLHLARQIRRDKVINREKIIQQVLAECFNESNEDNNDIRKHIEKRLDFILEENDNRCSNFVQLIEDKCISCSSNYSCQDSCPTGAIIKNEQGHIVIDSDQCIDCGNCIDSCIAGMIVQHSDFAQVAKMILQHNKQPVYAILAPSFVGQFGNNVTPEMFKGALKSIGFTDVLEVAMAADIITKHEAEIFLERMNSGEKYVITSCCCPAFVKLVEKSKAQISHLITPSVSPMIAMGKLLKKREPECNVVFIGPCIAKKHEAKQKNLQPAIDLVLTFKETKALLDSADVQLDGSLGESLMEDASGDGRNYAHIGGVTNAIKNAVKILAPQKEIKAVMGNGLKDCKHLLEQLEAGTLDANFMEGMACIGGCVGGPGTILDYQTGTKFVAEHAARAKIGSALDNPKSEKWEQLYGNKVDLSEF